MMTNPTTKKPTLTEAQLQAAIIEAAERFGWLVHHGRPARVKDGWRTAITGAPGYPDLTLARRGRVLWLEVKGPRGRLRPHQAVWGAILGSTGDDDADWLALKSGEGNYAVARPQHWFDGRVVEVLGKFGRKPG